jgi:diaminopropionate ammonia-lyase
VSALKQRGDLRTDDTLACASEGNHGRAVAHAARAIGCAARVYLSTNVAPARVRAIESEGAHVVRVPGTYDDAVRAMVRDARARGWRVISDTALGEDDREIPRLIMLGYTRLMDEAAAQWGPDAAPDAIFVPGGVGGLLAAVADWARALGPHPPAVVAVEPTTAACLQASARAGQPVALPGPFESMMAGLRCGEVSRAAFETVRDNVAAYVAIEDEWAAEAMRRLAAGSNTDPPILAGASGAAALGGLLAVVRDPALAPVKEALGLGGDSRALILVTEGVTDPELFASIVPNPKNEQSGLKNREP